MAMTHEEYTTKMAQTDEVCQKMEDFRRKNRISARFFGDVRVEDDGTLSSIPEEVSASDYERLFEHLGMSSLQFRDFQRTRHDVLVKHQEIRAKDPNCFDIWEQ